MKIKICGITNAFDARLVSEAGADAVGFIFAPSPRRIPPEKVREINMCLPPFVAKVGVFVNENISTVKEIMDYCILDWVQFHGEEDPAYLRQFAPQAIKVFHIKERPDLIKIKKFDLSFFMLDLPKNKKDEGDWNWRIAREAKKWGKVILAGGLNPENVTQAVQMALPYGLDVCRGVEAAEGTKNPGKVKKFIRKVREWQLRKA